MCHLLKTDSVSYKNWLSATCEEEWSFHTHKLRDFYAPTTIHRILIHTLATTFLLLPFAFSFLFAYLQYLVTFFLSKDQKNRKDQYRTSIHLSYHPWKNSRRKGKKIRTSIFLTNKTHFDDRPSFTLFALPGSSVPSASSTTPGAYKLVWFTPRISGDGGECTAFWEAWSQATPHQSSAGADGAPASAGSPEWKSLVLQDRCQDRTCRGQRSVRTELKCPSRTGKAVFGSIQMAFSWPFIRLK